MMKRFRVWLGDWLPVVALALAVLAVTMVL
jgi:hypothetical protein